MCAYLCVWCQSESVENSEAVLLLDSLSLSLSAVKEAIIGAAGEGPEPPSRGAGALGVLCVWEGEEGGV